MASISKFLFSPPPCLSPAPFSILVSSGRRLPLYPIFPGIEIQIPRKLSALAYTQEKKRGGKKKNSVKFADNVKEETESEAETKNKDLRGKHRKQNRPSRSCSHETLEIRGMPENQIALYNEILRDRVPRLEYSY